MEEERKFTKEEVKAIALAAGLGVMKDTAKVYLMRGIKIGFLGGLTMGWIAGGLVMLWLS